MMKTVIFLAIAFSLFGCAASGPKYKQQNLFEPGMATVYFYRPSRFFQGGGGPDVYIDGMKRFRMLNNGYHHLFLNPGSHSIQPRNHSLWSLAVAATYIEVDPDEVYYFRMDIQDASAVFIPAGSVAVGAVSGTTKFVPVEESVANKEIIKTKYSK